LKKQGKFITDEFAPTDEEEHGWHSMNNASDQIAHPRRTRHRSCIPHILVYTTHTPCVVSQARVGST
jgi:hypothetical protein